MKENEESKLKRAFIKFKQLWKDKRYRSLIILLLYFLFFLIIFSILKFNSDKVKVYTDKTISFEDYNIYDFDIELNINTGLYNLTGKRHQDRYEFTYNNQQFNMNYEEIIESNLDGNIINIFEFTPYFINNMLENAVLISEKKIVATNELVKEYSLELSKYLQMLDYNLNTYNNDDQILITITEIDNEVTSIKLDLTDFYKNLEENYQEYEITINYSNFNHGE